MKIISELPEIEAVGTNRPRRRMVVMQRDDGNFTFVEQHHYINEYDGVIIAQGWAALSPEGIYTTADEAAVEARATLTKRYQQKA